MKVELFFFRAGLITLGISATLSIGYLIFTGLSSRQKMKRRGNIRATKSKIAGKAVVIAVSVLSLIFITVSIISRAIATGHGPFSSMYEFAQAFSWGILAVTLFFWWKYRSMAINTAGSIIAFGLLLYANTLPSRTISLVPALQQSFLLSAHVASAVIAYGAFTVSFVTAVFYMFQRNERFSWLPASESLDRISYHAVLIGFPFMTLVIVLGAFWADIAWGRYWGWDPKETASLVTWLIYAAYFHTRLLRGWRGRKAALLLILGFIAVLFTFFGNYIFSGLHSYG